MIEFERDNSTDYSFTDIKTTELKLQAGQGNYDFDFIITFEDDTVKKFKYEYKHHPVDKLPQLLSLYDVKNPKDPDKPAIKVPGTDGYIDGQWWAKYTCLKSSKIPKKGTKLPFEFWEGNPFWKSHLNDNEHGIPKIRQELLSKFNIILPDISEEDYFCGVKSTDGIPGRSSNKQRNILECNTIQDCLNKSQMSSTSDEDRTWIKKQIKKMNKWLKYMDLHHPDEEDKYKIIRFFQILFDYSSPSSNIPSSGQCNTIRNKLSITKYLKNFVSNKVAKDSLINRLFKEIHNREYNKRFIFYYPRKDDWHIGKPYEDTWNKPVSSNVTYKGDNLYINTSTGNRFNFNLRWANTIGLQNPAWKMNILKGLTGKKKLNVDIIHS